MPLEAGTQLGPYRIVAPLGAGGMGEVYRAWDDRLRREVAVKILPADVAGDPDRLRRFDQEARAAGGLNHPNILAVHDVGTHEGIPYVVTELLEGKNLRDLIGGSPLPARKAIDYAAQAADGLAAAHAKSIVHRDLKPENLFVTPDGRVKILDFGLARVAGPREPDVSSAPTREAATEPGKVLGTAGYMSPEQVRGVPADHRSDIFSLGAVLYEMLSGRRAFRGDTAVETMSAILKEDPPSLAVTTAAASGMPAGLARLVEHALEKSPEERFQSARDLAFDLRAAGEGSGAVTGAAAARAGARRRVHPAAWLAIGFAAGALAVAAYVSPPGAPDGAASARAWPEFTRITFGRGIVDNARFAPDGRTILYDAAWQGGPRGIHSTRPESPESFTYDLRSARLAAVSKRGDLAIFLRGRALLGWMTSGTLARLPMTGAVPRELLDDVVAADWGPDGESLAVVRCEASRCRLEYPAGKALYETAGWIESPRVSPDGERVAFIDHPVLKDNAGRAAVVDRAGRMTKLSGDWGSATGIAWSPDGSEVWLSGREKGPASLLKAFTLEGEERLVFRSSAGTIGIRDIAPDGRVLMVLYNSSREMAGVRDAGAAGGAAPVHGSDLSWHDWSFPTDLSADGRTLLFMEQGLAEAQYGTYLRGTDGSPAVRLASGIGAGLSPDGRWVVHIPMGWKPPITLLPAAAGESRTLNSGDLDVITWAAWMPDGKRIVIAGRAADEAADRLWISDPNGGPPAPVPGDVPGQHGSIVSPDGTLIAVPHPAGPTLIHPIAGGAPQPVPGLGEGETVVGWDADGRTLYVAHLDRIPVAVDRLDRITGRRSRWETIAPADPAGIDTIGPMLVSRDGRTIVYSFRRLLTSLYEVEGLD